MKAITLWQPWASLVALGVKRIETRSWATSYRGPIAIHAAKRDPGERRVGDYATAAGHLTLWGHERALSAYPLPLGAIVATATLADVVPILARNNAADLWERHVRNEGESLCRWTGFRRVDVTDQFPYGDFTPGRFAWLLEDVKPTTERCPTCWWRGRGYLNIPGLRTISYPDCPTCEGNGRCDPISAKGHQQLWEWTP